MSTALEITAMHAQKLKDLLKDMRVEFEYTPPTATKPGVFWVKNRAVRITVWADGYQFADVPCSLTTIVRLLAP